MARVDTPTDDVLLRRMTAGDEGAFEALYDRRQGGIYRFALRMSGSQSVAEDVTQDVFVALINDADKYDPARGSVAAYLFGMARHRVLRRLQRERLFVAISADDEPDDGSEPEAAAAGDPLADLLRTRTIESVRQAILSLPVHYREVVVLCDLQEMNYADAAQVLGCAVGTVRSRLHRGREMLAGRLRAAGVAGEPARGNQVGRGLR